MPHGGLRENRTRLAAERVRKGGVFDAWPPIGDFFQLQPCVTTAIAIVAPNSIQSDFQVSFEKLLIAEPSADDGHQSMDSDVRFHFSLA